MTSDETFLKSLSFLSEQEIQFLSEQTGIHDTKELDAHLTQIQAEAYAVSTPAIYIGI